MNKNPYIYNLRLNELTEVALLDKVMASMGKGFYLDPFDSYTNAMGFILREIDDTDTMNYLSYIPLDFLREYFKTNKEYKSRTFKDAFAEKKYLVNLITPSNVRSIMTMDYRGVPIKYLQKSILDCSIDTNIPFHELTIGDDMEQDMGLTHIDYFQHVNKSAWFSNIEIDEVFKRLCYFNVSNVFAHATPTFYFSVVSEVSILMEIYPTLEKHIKYVLDNGQKAYEEGRTVILYIPIIFCSHFVVIVVNFTARIISFFNSAGFNNKEVVSLDYIKYFFLDDSFIYKEYKEDNFDSSVYNRYVVPFCQAIYKITDRYISSPKKGKKVLRDKNFFLKKPLSRATFNAFSIQKSRVECGAFITSFCIGNQIINPKDEAAIKWVYNSVTLKGDYTTSFIRSFFFITDSDLSDRELSRKEYDSNISTFKIKNEHFNNHMKLHMDNCDKLRIVVDDISNKQKAFVTAALYNGKSFHKALEEFEGLIHGP